MNDKLYQKWLAKAQDDFESAILLLEKAYPPKLEIACYHCQQCGEKALKTFCVYKSVEFPKTHNLVIMCQLCMEIDNSFASLIPSCSFLTPYSVQTRYPSAIEIIDEDAKVAITHAKKIFEFVKEKVKA